MNMSRNAADASSSASGPPPGEHHTRTPHQRRSSHSPSGRTAPPDTQPAHRASPSSHAASQPPSSAALRVDTAAAASSSDPETGRRKRKQSERSSPSASSSQGDMADTEMEGGPSKPSTSEGGAPEGQPPKKKRTRTLTTPHQAAVLHALLAQVRPRAPPPSPHYLTRFLRPARTLTRPSCSHVSPPRKCARRSDEPLG